MKFNSNEEVSSLALYSFIYLDDQFMYNLDNFVKEKDAGRILF